MPAHWQMPRHCTQEAERQIARSQVRLLPIAAAYPARAVAIP